MSKRRRAPSALDVQLALGVFVEAMRQDFDAAPDEAPAAWESDLGELVKHFADNPPPTKAGQIDLGPVLTWCSVRWGLDPDELIVGAQDIVREVQG